MKATTLKQPSQIHDNKTSLGKTSVDLLSHNMVSQMIDEPTPNESNHPDDFHYDFEAFFQSIEMGSLWARSGAWNHDTPFEDDEDKKMGGSRYHCDPPRSPCRGDGSWRRRCFPPRP